MEISLVCVDTLGYYFIDSEAAVLPQLALRSIRNKPYIAFLAPRRVLQFLARARIAAFIVLHQLH